MSVLKRRTVREDIKHWKNNLRARNIKALYPTTRWTSAELINILSALGYVCDSTTRFFIVSEEDMHRAIDLLELFGDTE